MKRILLALLILSLLASPAWALKKTLIFVPDNEYTQTGWCRLAATGLVYEGGGSYDIINMADDTTGIRARLVAARTAGTYGLVVFIVGSDVYLTHATAYPSHGGGKFAQFCDISQNPLGIPTVVIAGKSLARNADYAAKFYDGVTAANNWAKGALNGGSAAGSADSLWTRLSTGDSVLSYKLAANATWKRHLLDTDGSPENTAGYTWTVDAWTKVGVGAASKVAPGNGATVYMWHVHKTAADAAAVPSAQRFVVHYIPCFGLTRQSGCEGPIKYLAALLKRYDCIKDFPVSLFFDDYGFQTTATFKTTMPMTKALYWAATDSLLQYCSDRHLPIMVNTQYANAGAFGYNVVTQDTATVVANMAKWYPNPYVRFGWHASDLYSDAAKTSSYTIFTTWGDGATEKAKVLLRDLRRDYYLLGTSGMLQYMKDSDAFIFNGGDYNGVAGYNKNDTIFQALAAVGVRKFLIETPNTGYLVSGNNFYTMFYPHTKYPLDLTWTGTSAWVNARMVCTNYYGLSLAQADSAYYSPAALSDSVIVSVAGVARGPISILTLYTSFAKLLFNNGREQDATSTRTWDDAGSAAWPQYFNFELRGWSPYIHQSGLAISNTGVYYNSGLLWLKHYWNNLRAYNNLAKTGDATIGNVFNPVFLTEADQKVGPKD
jgi:hypothetical protein